MVQHPSASGYTSGHGGIFVVCSFGGRWSGLALGTQLAAYNWDTELEDKHQDSTNWKGNFQSIPCRISKLWHVAACHGGFRTLHELIKKTPTIFQGFIQTMK